MVRVDASPFSKSYEEDLAKEVVIPYAAPLSPIYYGNLDRIETSLASAPKIEVAKQETGFFKSIWNWLTGVKEEEEIQEELTPEQKEKIEEIYQKTQLALSEIAQVSDEELEEAIDITKELAKLYKELDAVNELAIRNQADSYQKKRTELDEKRKELSSQKDELIKRLEAKAWWTRFSLLVAPIQAAAVGLSLSTGAGFAIAALSIVMAAENLSGGMGKEYIAKSFAKDDTIAQEKIEYNLELIATFLSLGSALYASGSPETVGRVAGIMGGITSVGGIFGEQRVNNAQADLIKIRYKGEMNEKKWAKAASEVSKLEQTRLSNVKKIMHIMQGDYECSIAVLRD